MTRNPQNLIFEPLSFHDVCGSDMELSDQKKRATRKRLGSNLIFTNRPILPNETVQFVIENLNTGFQGAMRIGFTTINPNSFTNGTIPRAMPQNDNQKWIVPNLTGINELALTEVVQASFSMNGDILVGSSTNTLRKRQAVPPIDKDVWYCIDLLGSIVQIRLIQDGYKVSNSSIERAKARYFLYSNNERTTTYSTYYGEELQSCHVVAEHCDPINYTNHLLVIRTHPDRSFLTVEKTLKRGMLIVLQIIDMDHTLSDYFTIKCLTNGHENRNMMKFINEDFDYMTIGDEIGIRVQIDGTLTFSSNNRHVKSLFEVDLSPNDKTSGPETKFYLNILLNGRVTGIRLIGVHESKEAIGPQPVSGGCQSRSVTWPCPNGISGLLIPCRHLVVCFDCGQKMKGKDVCPNVNCRKQVVDCIKVFRG